MTPSSEQARVVEITDDRDPLALAALQLIATTFDPTDRQPIEQLRSEVEEKRRDLLDPFDFHLVAVVEGDDVLAAITGAYLQGINAGFVMYLAVQPGRRSGGLGRAIRRALVQRFREDARHAGKADLAFVLGEVRASNPWLRRLVSKRGAIPFDLTYYHPGMRPDVRSPAYVLYRQPVADDRVILHVAEVRRILYSVYRRGYRVRYPLLHGGFRAMLEQLEGRETVGAHSRFAQLLYGGGNPASGPARGARGAGDPVE